MTANEGLGTRPVSEQLVLPLDLRPNRTVSWFNAVLVERKRRIFRNRFSIESLFEDDPYLPSKTTIDAGDCSKIRDPELRCALRLADAAKALGPEETSSGSSLSHSVVIDATNEGFDSKLLAAWFTGIEDGPVDTFMESLHGAKPLLTSNNV